MPLLALTHAIAIAVSVGLDHADHPGALPWIWSYTGAVAFIHLVRGGVRKS